MVTWDPSALFPPFSSLKGKVAAGAPSPNPTLCLLTIYTPRNKPVANSSISSNYVFTRLFKSLKTKNLEHIPKPTFMQNYLKKGY